SDNEARFSGSAIIGGNSILQGSIKSSGSFKVEGKLEGGLNAKFSGSAKIGKETVVQGLLKSSGSFNAGDNVQAVQGLKTSGSARIDGNVLSQRSITIEGSSAIAGNVVAEDVNIGFSRWWKNLRIFSIRERPYSVSGSIFAKNNVNIKRTFVKSDVKGLNVAIRKRSKVEGTVYYVDSIRISRSAELANEPIRIKAEELSL
ncbi:MAG: polymer-forming cytoskeletal protein, partial [Candidatus Heimdallarchaeota archaeon]